MRKFWYLTQLALCGLLLLTSGCRGGQLQVCDLRCEYLEEPLGIDNPYRMGQTENFEDFSPRLSWKVTAADGSAGQTAYQLVVAASRRDVEKGQNLLWSSGTVEQSGQYCFLPAEIMRPGQAYYWKVGVCSGDSHSFVWSRPARFTTGLTRDGWKGKWIDLPDAPAESHVWFRKEIVLPGRTNVAADCFAYVASLGYHELYVNGQKADDRVLAPAISRIDKRVLYVTYDIGRLLRPGRNVIAVAYGPGWSMNNYFAYKKSGRGILMQVCGGDRFSLSTDSTWRCSRAYSRNAGRFDFMNMGGELVDGRLYTDCWADPDFDDSSWCSAADVRLETHPVLSPQMTDPSHIVATIEAVKITEIIDSMETDPRRRMLYRVDMGREFTGFLEARFEDLVEGDTVEMMVSMRDSNPEFVQATCGIGNYVIEEQRQRQIYVARGEDGESFRNRFNFFAGRYIHFRGLRKAPELGDVKGLAVSSAAPLTASFACSDELYNEIFRLDAYTYQMCHTEGVTVDCPNRERLGYGPEGAYQTMWGLGLPCFGSAAYYIKNVRDWADVQSDDGYINNVAPQVSVMYGCVLNGNAILNTAWEHYMQYGDERVLRMACDVGKKWLGFLGRHVEDSLLTRYAHHGYFLGEWVSPGPVFEYAETEEALFFNNCAYVMALDYMADIAEVLGNTGDSKRYAEQRDAVRRAIHRKYYDRGRGVYLNGDQVRTSFALYAGVVPDSLREGVANYLADKLTEQDYIDVGSFGRYPFYKTLLADHRYGNILGDIVARRDYPGYGYFVEQGCTTLPEMWEIDQPNSTVIHTSYTGISAFFFRCVAGISELSPGCGTVLIAPVPIKRLSWCRASRDTPYGTVVSAWKRDGDGIVYELEIPFGMTAKVRLPGEEMRTLTAGSYRFGSDSQP